jgi:hypothetical protein
MPFCCRCKEDFPAAPDDSWAMGQMRRLQQAPRRIQEQFRDWLNSEDGAWLCGNCYFDLTDEP